MTQADIARTIRAMRDAGLPVARIIIRPDGVALETAPGPTEAGAEKLAGERKVVVL